mmetsp:Transcript_27724/g.54418  ORF Transcript_27724/g.54418 Transcript_27724/m.54418 type:complete len:268 (-) Transcript_27724:82-885(-)
MPNILDGDDPAGWCDHRNFRRPRNAHSVSTPSLLEIQARLRACVEQLHRAPDSPDLYQLNDEANALLRELPLRHALRGWAMSQGLQLPGRAGYVYFGRCAELPYVKEACLLLAPEKNTPSRLMSVAERLHVCKEDAKLSENSANICSQRVPNLAEALARQRICGRDRAHIVHAAAKVAAQTRYEQSMQQEVLAAAAARAAEEWRELLTTQKERSKRLRSSPPRVDCNDCTTTDHELPKAEKTVAGGYLGTQDPLAYLSDDSDEGSCN